MLTPIERTARKRIVWFLAFIGCTVTTITHVMNMHQSTVSRMVNEKPSKWHPMRDQFFAQFKDK